MDTENNSVFPAVSQNCADALVQRIGEVLSASPGSLAKVKEINISAVPVITYRIDVTIVPEK
jgi:hypothetical protein